ncbi:MAG: RNA 2',3'-cyclic phosphodiesterase [Calditrichaeota bacterium]|nr:RNA 2',3'-cyclic phosphodiesterase [Calditrichota bacterium]
MSSSETVRTFIAIETPESAKQTIRLIQNELSGVLYAKVTWAKAAGFHLTLKFLGDIKKSQILEISDCLKSCVNAMHPFEVVSTVCGAFPGMKRPRVLWVGVDGGQQLMQLQYDIRNSLESIGFDPDRKEYHPHLTVGRVKSIQSNSTLPELFKDMMFPQIVWVANDVRLMSSILKSGGAEYKVIEKFKFSDSPIQ